jgi:hypothetical protein
MMNVTLSKQHTQAELDRRSENAGYNKQIIHMQTNLGRATAQAQSPAPNPLMPNLPLGGFKGQGFIPTPVSHGKLGFHCIMQGWMQTRTGLTASSWSLDARQFVRNDVCYARRMHSVRREGKLD